MVDKGPHGRSPARAGHPCWVKRGDACAQSAGDVRYVENAALLPEVIDDFAARGIEEVVICDHAEGDLVKFYGVEGDPFFYFFYPTSGEHFSKFGLEAINGAPRNYHFDANALKQCADHTARCTQMPIYGGDCIVRPDGSWVIIDFNDWPSFSLCCEEAATAIARHVAFRP